MLRWPLDLGLPSLAALLPSPLQGWWRQQGQPWPRPAQLGEAARRWPEARARRAPPPGRRALGRRHRRRVRRARLHDVLLLPLLRLHALN
ncbi:hypothetical protein PR202_gb19670 [Eleusine coracana subsp. coracana]|uniref:Uncharacterized protein n=1 Tax=Eleusine coracana subsp. coracana TaxID=191504 RepID=A0AAV5F6K3_ELECO|nr:hypothetical protein PR202_gb19670 [Eleusine coracana subsp. coracana]